MFLLPLREGKQLLADHIVVRWIGCDIGAGWSRPPCTAPFRPRSSAAPSSAPFPISSSLRHFIYRTHGLAGGVTLRPPEQCVYILARQPRHSRAKPDAPASRHCNGRGRPVTGKDRGLNSGRCAWRSALLPALRLQRVGPQLGWCKGYRDGIRERIRSSDLPAIPWQ